MDKLTKITRAETTYVEQNWRQGAGGRVLTFDMMLEVPHSPTVAALDRNSGIVFEDKRYTVNHTEVVRKASPETVRIVLNRTGHTAETWSGRSRRPTSPGSFSPVGNVPLPSHGAASHTF
jgi:hypothetical protein